MTETIKQAKNTHNTPKKIQTHEGKSEKTKARYLKEANDFIQKNLIEKGIKVTAGNICKALKIWSETVQANTYIAKQCALEYHQYCHKFYKAAEQIRNTQRINYGVKGNGTKKPHCKTVKESQHIKLLLESNKKGDRQVSASLSISYFLGLRPAEQNNIEYSDKDGEFLLFIRSAKKNKDGTRSIDKVIKVELEDGQRQQLINDIKCLYGIADNKVVNVRNRVCRLSKKCFPKLKKPPTLYSYRNQLGSDLRGSKIVSRRMAAGIFGHKSQNSLNSYGHANSAGGLKRSLPQATESTISQVNNDLIQTEFWEEKVKEDEASRDAENAKQEQSASPTSVLAQETVSESVPVTKHESTETDKTETPSLAHFILEQLKADESSTSEPKPIVEQTDKPTASRHNLEDDTDYK